MTDNSNSKKRLTIQQKQNKEMNTQKKSALDTGVLTAYRIELFWSRYENHFDRNKFSSKQLAERVNTTPNKNSDFNNGELVLIHLCPRIRIEEFRINRTALFYQEYVDKFLVHAHLIWNASANSNTI